MPARITFMGAAQTVTGSRHLLTINGKNTLVDCGLFQGSHELNERNWQPFPIDPSHIDAVVITHAHMDHIGWLPRLIIDGYKGPIYATRATVELARISLPDSGRLQEEEARRNLKHNHGRPTPLYTEKDAYRTMKQFVALPYDLLHPLPGGAQWKYVPAGHILGSAFAQIYFENGEQILMSGDLGRFNTPIIKDPTVIDFTEYLVVESTYGDRSHPKDDPKEQLFRVISDVLKSGGVLVTPSFAIGRTQEILYYISELQREGRLPRFPIYVDSPMATSTTKVYMSSHEEHDGDTKEICAHAETFEPQGLTYIRDSEQSKMLNSQRGPMMIISGSGMANGGRVVHHLLHRLSHPDTTVLFTGYQAEGTLGRRLLEGQEPIHIMGQEVEVRAKIEKINALSAHAGQDEIMTWLRNFKTPPKHTFIVHGEPRAQQALADLIQKELGWELSIPAFLDTYDLVK
ncbi:MAG: MBL fold metallo-hydrolase [Armatimonadetes bacterium]|nr:MBL fold metallo-hydrolase [Armatimonadota bacterium]